MKPSRFAHVAQSVSLATPITRGARWLEDGTHRTVIEDIDAEQAESKGTLRAVFKDEATKAVHKESIFILDREGSGFSNTMRKLLGATLPDLTARNDFLALLANEATSRRVLESLRGMHVAITLRTKDGFRVRFDVESAMYVATMPDGQVIASATELTETVRRAKALGKNRAFRELVNVEVIDEDTAKANLVAFSNVVASIKKATPVEAISQADFAGSTRHST